MAISITTHWDGGTGAVGVTRRYELLDSATQTRHTREWVWKTAPTEAQIDAAGLVIITNLERELYPPAPEPQYRVICEDGTEVLL